MSVMWTDSQKKVIDTRGKNLLVSAAAGSGKTAVLVERIIQMITDDKDPIDIDKLLVVTFTNAAASQMRERILEAIQKKLETDPENEHLHKQQTFIHNAYITTIHSFCLRVIREHFNEIEIDPGFRVAEEGELTLLKSDILEELLESYYDNGQEEFYQFIETYASGKGDDNIEELILNLYEFSMSYPWPKDWLTYCENNYQINIEDIESSLWYNHLGDYVQRILEDYRNLLLNAIKLCQSEDGPHQYEEALEDDLNIIDQMIHIKSFNQRVQELDQLKFATLSRKKDDQVSEVKKEEVKAIRQRVKDGLKALKSGFYCQTQENMVESIKNSAPPTKILLQLVKEFYDRFMKAKREKNIIDFHDIEHLAFQILVAQDDKGNSIPTNVAKELSNYFEEIIIDEYQDSNLLQELILKSVSKETVNKPNIFMVGDVKQSIYKFRMAKPELFVEKYDRYSTEDISLYQRINLEKNFRSRTNILNSINLIFKQIMGKSLGDIEYDEDNALHPGVIDKELPFGQKDTTEVLLVEGKEEGKELEAQVIANRIKELVDPKQGIMILDKYTGEYRVARYSDIVILYRSLSGQAEIIEEKLMTEGIPCYVESREGYFNALEIKVILSLLSIIDNPMQDIELTAILKSPIVGLSSLELAQIRIQFPEVPFHQAVADYAITGQDNGLKEKLESFLQKLSRYRIMSTYLSIYELLTFILSDTGYYLYISAMPSGDRRKANMDMLKERAISFENSSYKGVFNFIRYIEKLKKYKVDFPQANTISENDNTVRIMSIHKSKGLEFPIVIVGGLGKKFNNQDVISKIVLHSEYGIGVDYIDLEQRAKEQTLIKKSIALKLKLENQAEELRVLYVALTRAKEKLILVGTTKNMEKQMQKWMGERFNLSIKVSFETLVSATNYLDWIGYALVRHSSFSPVYRQLGLPINFTNPLYDETADIMVRYIDMQEVTYEKVKDTIQKENLKKVLLNWDNQYTYNQEVKEDLKSRLSYTYPFSANQEIHTKMSVSEIKKLSQSVDIEYSSNLIKEQSGEEPVPRFFSAQQELSSTSKGTAYHRILELLDFTIEPTCENINAYIAKLIQGGYLKEREALAIEVSVLLSFLTSELGSRMINADYQRCLFREQQYVMGINANEIHPEYAKEEIVLIQGIIDAYFEEDNEVVIVDYKTDKVKDIHQLINRYRVQLDYYEKAITQITGKRVKEKIIYSLYLGKEGLVE